MDAWVPSLPLLQATSRPPNARNTTPTLLATPDTSRPLEPPLGEGGSEARWPVELPPESVSLRGGWIFLGEARPPSLERCAASRVWAIKALVPWTGQVGEGLAGGGLGGAWVTREEVEVARAGET